jgi:NitT/TauT family transport system ATP-binding protein
LTSGILQTSLSPVPPAGMTAPIVEVRGLSKIYPGGVEALNNISLSFPEGELTTLLGPSGCGKTTLLKIIAGLLEPTSGEILIRGRRVTGPGPERSFVFQDFALLPWATALENAEFGLRLRGVPAAERTQAARRALAKVGIADSFEQAYPSQLSGGMQQRLQIARCLAQEPTVLLMDEPFGALDEQTRVLMGEWLLDIWRRMRKTIVFVTHSLHEALALSTRIVIMTARPGRIKSVLELPMPYPRAMESPELVALRAKLWSDIRDESLRAMQ